MSLFFNRLAEPGCILKGHLLRTDEKRSMKATLALFLLLLPLPLLAQRPPSPEETENRTAMQHLDFLVGTWEGEGWMERAGQQYPFLGHEVVQSLLDDMIVTVEGLHKANVPGHPEPVVVHNAFGVFSYDAEADHYRFKTYLSNGQGGDYDAHLRDDALVWTMESPRMGTVRYTIRIDEQGRWHEIGERSADGKTWEQFFEMTLARQEE